MSAAKRWFEVDKEGLAKVVERKGKAFIIYELVANAFDADKARHVHVNIRPWPSTRRVDITVEDDAPDGFANLAHAWTLFAESERKGDVSKRGRFNLGEKLVLAACTTAEIVTTKGGVWFDAAGRHVTREKRVAGSAFTGTIRATHAAAEELVKAARRIIPPPGVTYQVQGVVVPSRAKLAAHTVTLPTEKADEEGRITRTVRACAVDFYATGTPGWLYELGIPVVEIGGPVDVDVRQKVPLNMDRDNVTPAYLTLIRAHTLNALASADKVPQGAAAKEKWIDDAMGSPDVGAPAVRAVVAARFGERAVIADPSDPEGTKDAMSKGYTVVPGGAFSADAWANVKATGVILPAGQVTPSYMSAKGKVPDKVYTKDEWTFGMANVVDFATKAVEAMLGVKPSVRFIHDEAIASVASWSGGGPTLTFNLAHAPALRDWAGHDKDRQYGTEEGLLALVIHEAAHHHGGPDHLASKFYDECCRLGAVLALSGWEA